MLAVNVIDVIPTERARNYIDMKNSIVLLVFITLFCSKIFGQEHNGILKGKITFVTSQNVYVNFENTDNIKVGDTLNLSNSAKPCLIVTNKSSKSVVAVIINGCEVKKDDEVTFKFLINQEPLVEVKKVTIPIDSISIKPVTVSKKAETVKNLERISGKFSIASYSNIYSTRPNRQKIITRFNIYADHINNSKYSFESYLNYNKDIRTVTNNYTQNQSPFKVYSFALTYDKSPTLSIAIGRKINNSISSVGAIDGLQVEKHFGKNYVGAIVGFRPDLFDYGFNSNLFEYGAYIGRLTNTPNLYSQTTFGIIEQQKNGKVDRRYTYFQHSSTFFNKLNLFSSFEVDIFNKFNGLKTSSARLTNFYASTRYKFSKTVDASISFDSRKSIIYYETFQSEVERLLSDDVARQGLRFRINTKPLKYVNAGASYSIRYQSDKLNKSENINAYFSMYQIPNIGGSFNFNFNNNTSNYLKSNILSFSHSRTMFKDQLSTDFYFRTVDYTYNSNNLKTKENYFGIDLSININRNLRFSLDGEYQKGDLEKNYRINTQIIKRFNNNKKKTNYAY